MTASTVIGTNAQARPGLHAEAVNTFDTRASSLALGYRRGFFEGGRLSDTYFGASFASTTGLVNAQFGFHYLRLTESSLSNAAHGAGAAAVAVFTFPIEDRHPNGLTRTALHPYIGMVPAVYISGEKNFATFPLVTGLGFSGDAGGGVTFTPWVELAPELSLDSVVKAPDLDVNDLTNNGTTPVTEEAVRRLLKESVEIETSFSVTTRAGLLTTMRLHDAVDLNIDLMLSSLGPAFRGALVKHLGVLLVWRWDNVVPGVLPADQQLRSAECPTVAARYRSCQIEHPEEIYGPEYTVPRAPRGGEPTANPRDAWPEARIEG